MAGPNVTAGQSDLEQDPRKFFDRHYARHGVASESKTDTEVDAYLGQPGLANPGAYTKKQLQAYAGAARKRRQAAQPVAAGGGDTPQGLARYERLIQKIGIGAYVLAAIGLIFHAIAIRKFEPNFDNLRPYIVGIIISTVLLFVLSLGVRELRRVTGAEKARRVLLIALLGLFAVIAAGVVLWLVVFILRDAGVLPPLNPTPNLPPPIVAPPEKFDSTSYNGADAIELPAELFGQRDDTVGMPRLWMRALQAGAECELGAGDRPAEALRNTWLLTPEFDQRYAGFSAHVYTTAKTKIVPIAFRVRPLAGAAAELTPLSQTTGGTPGLYIFAVPPSEARDRLLVLMTMTRTAYDRERGGTKFWIRSQPDRK